MSDSPPAKIRRLEEREEEMEQDPQTEQPSVVHVPGALSEIHINKSICVKPFETPAASPFGKPSTSFAASRFANDAGPFATYPSAMPAVPSAVFSFSKPAVYSAPFPQTLSRPAASYATFSCAKSATPTESSQFASPAAPVAGYLSHRCHVRAIIPFARALGLTVDPVLENINTFSSFMPSGPPNDKLP